MKHVVLKYIEYCQKGDMKSQLVVQDTVWITRISICVNGGYINSVSVQNRYHKVMPIEDISGVQIFLKPTIITSCHDRTWTSRFEPLSLSNLIVKDLSPYHLHCPEE